MRIHKSRAGGTANIGVPTDFNNHGRIVNLRDKMIGFHDKISDFFNPGPKWQEDKKDPKER